MTASSVAPPAVRRPELDAIRLVVVLGLVFFHAGLVFDARDDFYVKNPQTTEAVTWLAGLGVVWAMPALFLIAGFGAWHSLRRRGAAGFARERLLRLGVPLLFASVTLLPLPQWLRLKSAGTDESYWRFLGRYFDVHVSLSDFPFLVQGEHFETGHLWFVVLLLAFSLIVAVPAAWLPRGRDALAAVTARRGLVLLLPAIPIALVGAILGMEEPFAGWSRWAYLLFFVYGLVLAADDRFREAMRRDAKIAAVAGILLFGAAGMALSTADGDPFTDMTAHAVVARVLFATAGWCWVVAILGLLDRPSRDAGRPTAGQQSGSIDRRSKAYAYLAAAALPLYILHQPIVVAVAYFVVRWQLPAPIKYLAIVAASFAIMFAVYDIAVRRTRVTRFLFGMRTG
ncbi:acyltransferase family protein [Actinoplanes aureus]|uniref:Acyltransferase family protein n=1 Tax=Actinoplanes aureus TaxID=2792083 RepID=A0A931FZK6_9ACTN|nr:acyltransferase family protein [Actinoplanes aureus]MBG0564870.1 acyltransferase family protein [Actinoplanes aureus]